MRKLERMTVISPARLAHAGLICLLLGLIATAGCATQRVNWGGRVGHYTYDQAVLELGPPDKKEKLQDGTLVAEWLTQHSYSQTYTSVGYGYPYWNYGPYYPAYAQSYSPNYYLRLIFAPDGNLKEWKKFTK